MPHWSFLGKSVELLACVTVVGGSLASAIFAQENREKTVDQPLPAAEAARTMVVPPGFQVTLFAGEPDVLQPVGFAIDDRGRLWVAEAHNYPRHGLKPGDRIVILEDVDGDGKHDRRTVFYDKLNYVTGIEVGFGGAWVMSPPYLYFIPDKNDDGIPDGKPQVLLDGFGTHANAHNLANGFSWGPDGWLYGTHGRTNWSLIGKPGTAEKDRIRFDGGVYRYHPVRHVWEPYADGTTNPWGIDWDDYGEAFVCNCVNPHLFHVIYGAHYEPWRNRVSSQYAYQRIDTIADHLHFVGKANPRDGLNSPAEDAAGGGHAHCGTMIYLGDNWPEQYRNMLFTNNIHGRRINNDLLRRKGSGYTASHGPDLMRSRDPWYMGVTLRYGPDGSVFASDWSDTGECHSTQNTRRETGRIYKISYGQPTQRKLDLPTQTSAELVQKQRDRNDWHVQHARRLLMERQAAGKEMSSAATELKAMFATETDVPRKLRALWALHAIGQAESSFLQQLLTHPNEYLRAWAIRLLCEAPLSPETLNRFRELAETDESPYVRLHLASMLQRMKFADRWPLVEALSQRNDAEDANIPLMLWYAAEPLCSDDLPRFVGLVRGTKIPLLANHIGRRAVALNQQQSLSSIARELAVASPLNQRELLAGTITGLAGRRSVKLPEGWAESYARLQKSDDAVVRERATQLALIFDDPVALTSLRNLLANRSAAAAERQRALTALLAKHDPTLPEVMLKLLDETELRRAAIRGLAEYNHPTTVEALFKRYQSFDAAARQDAVQTLAARPLWGLRLMEGVAARQIPRTDITAYTARQLLALGDPQLTARVKEVWGDLRSSPAEKQQLIAGYKKRLPTPVLELADRSAGRAVYHKLCANCHKFFDAGGNIGPDITGSQRTNLDYLLETIIDPSAAVAKDFQMQIVQTTGGRVISGLVVDETPAAITLQTVNEKIVVPVNEVEQRKTSPQSLMPEGMLQTLTADQVRNLIAYLMGPQQVSLPKNEEPAEK